VVEAVAVERPLGQALKLMLVAEEAVVEVMAGNFSRPLLSELLRL
jgi:hypothetical protein